MARFSPAFLEDLRSRVPVSEVVGKVVKLRKAGRELKGNSPFNKEKTPSFFVNDQKQAWFDFSSQKNGSIFDFVMLTEGVTFPEAVSPEVERQEEQRRSLKQVVELAAQFFQRQLGEPGGEPARRYLADRGIDDALIKSFRLGWAPPERFALKEALGAQQVSTESMIEAGLLIHGDDIPVPYDRFRGRVIFPIADARGNVVGFGARALGDEQPKYLNSPETPLFHKGTLLYNAHSARMPTFKGEPLIVVEGYVDVIALDGAGFGGAVAPLGTALGPEQMTALWRMADEPILCFDGDEPGKRAMDKAVDTALPLLRPGKSFQFAVLPKGQDPDDLVRAGGKEAVRKTVVDAARPFVDVLWSREAAVASALTTPEKRAVFEGRIKQLVGEIADADVRRHYGEELSKRTATLLKAPAKAAAGPPPRRHRAEYDYNDAAGNLLYQVVAFEADGGLALRRPADEDGIWIWGLTDGEYMRRPGADWYRYDEQRYVEWGCVERRKFPAATMVPYNLPAITEAIQDEMLVWLARSEELAENLTDRGLKTTTAAGGGRGMAVVAGALRGADIVILSENDEAGRQFAHQASMKLRGISKRTRVLDISQFWTGCPDGGGLSDWWDAGGTQDAVYEIIEKLNEWRPEPPKSIFGAIRHIEIDQPAREHQWLIKGIQTRGEQSILAGARSSGKSFLALDKAYAVARALEEPSLRFFGCRVHGGLVIYQAGEGKLGMRKRMRAYREYHRIEHGRDIPLVMMPKELNLHNDDDQTNKFIAECRAWSAFYDLPVELVVIDTFAKATPGANENDGRDMSKVMERGQRICDELRCHVEYVHHLNAAGSKVRGHSSLMAGVENGMEVEVTERREVEDGAPARPVRAARVTKQKDEADGARFNFVLKRVVLGFDKDGDEISSCVVCPTNEVVMPDKSENARGDRVGVFLTDSRVIFFRDALLSALHEHGIVPPSALKLPKSVDRVVEWDFVKIAYRKVLAPDESDARAKKDTLKTYVKRNRDFFQGGGIMGTDSVTEKHETEEGEADKRVKKVVETTTHYVWLTGKPVFGKGFAWPSRRKAAAEPARIVDAATGEDLTEDIPF
jgi:DNA primase catalytic core